MGPSRVPSRAMRRMRTWPAATSRSRPSTLVGLSRLLEPPPVWLVAVFLLGAMLLGTLQVLADEALARRGRHGRPDRVAHPARRGRGRLPRRHPARAVRAVAGARAARSPGCSSVGRWRSRRASTHAPTGLTADDRTAVLVTILLVGVPRVHRRRRDGSRRPGRNRRRRRARCPRRTCSSWLPATALVAFLLGYRAAALRVGHPARRPVVGRDLRWPRSPSAPPPCARWRSRG